MRGVDKVSVLHQRTGLAKEKKERRRIPGTIRRLLTYTSICQERMLWDLTIHASRWRWLCHLRYIVKPGCLFCRCF